MFNVYQLGEDADEPDSKLSKRELRNATRVNPSLPAQDGYVIGKVPKYADLCNAIKSNSGVVLTCFNPRLLFDLILPLSIVCKHHFFIVKQEFRLVSKVFGT